VVSYHGGGREVVGAARDLAGRYRVWILHARASALTYRSSYDRVRGSEGRTGT
jgi:hypothetical protein